jgi:hypothetical protein
MSQNENGQIAASIFGSIASAIISNNERQNRREDFERNVRGNVYGHYNYGYNNRSYDRPIYREHYQPVAQIIPQIIQASVSRDCYGNGNYSDYVRDQYRDNRSRYENCPRQIPNWNCGSTYPTYPTPSNYPAIPYPTSSYPTSSNYPSVYAIGNGMPNGEVEIAGRRITIAQNGTIDSYNNSGVKQRSFSVQGFGGFTPTEQAALRSGQPVEIDLGDDRRGKIKFYANANKTGIEAIEMRYGNQYSFVSNISGLNGGGLNVPNSQDQYNPNQNNPNQSNVV